MLVYFCIILNHAPIIFNIASDNKLLFLEIVTTTRIISPAESATWIVLCLKLGNKLKVVILISDDENIR